MNKTGMLLLFVVAMVFVIVAVSKTQEAFTSEKPVCPTSAIRGADGRITVQPGNKTFSTLSDYVGYLSGLYSNGATCIPPMVKNNKTPVDGILGGLGNGAEPPVAANLQGPTRTVLNTDLNGETTSANTKINKLDDYEYTRVFQSERGDRNSIDSQSKNQLIQNRRLDWANLPFNSETRAQEEDSFIAGRMESGYREPKTGVFFNTIAGDNIMPPDVEAAKLREQKLLAAYKPTDITKHIIDNETEAVANLVMKAYENDPNWEPVVTKVDENKWEVTELRPKPRKEKYADDKTAAAAMAEADTLAMPRPELQIDDRIRGDPYFDKTGVVDNDNKRFWNYNDFRKWTPGLERMFAPTADEKAWY
jgi:hypothetical protein